MIIKTYNGRTFEIQFQHNNVTNERPSTLVKLFEYENSKKVFVDFAIAYCNKSDKFSKSFGRRTAMKKLFKKVDLNKETRIDIWDEYFSEHNDFYGWQNK